MDRLENAADQPVADGGFRVVARLLCWGVGGLLAGGTLLYLFTAWATGPAWRTTTGSLIHAGVEADRRNGSCLSRRARLRGDLCPYTLYSPEISYRYQVAGREYLGDGIGDGINRNYYRRDEALAALGRYTRGPLTVYYDRSNPARSALDTGIVSRFFYIVGGIGLLLIATGFVLRETESGDEAAPETVPTEDDGEGYAPQR